MALGKLTPFKPLARPLNTTLNNTASRPINLGHSSAGILAGSSQANKINQAISIGQSNSTASMFGAKAQQQIKTHKVVGIDGQEVGDNISLNTLPLQPKSVVQNTINNTSTKVDTVTQFLHNQDLQRTPGISLRGVDSNLIPQKFAIPVGGNLSRQEQVQKQNESIKSVVEQKQQQVQATIQRNNTLTEQRNVKQTALDQRDIPAREISTTTVKSETTSSQPSTINISNASVVPKVVTSSVAQVNLTKADEQVNEQDEAQSKKPKNHISLGQIVDALIVHPPVVKNSYAIQEKFNNTTFLPESGGVPYEFYLEVDKSQTEVHQYLLDNLELCNRKKWFGFFVRTLNSKINNDPNRFPRAVTLNYQVPSNSFSSVKSLYFYFNIDVGGCSPSIDNKVQKNLLIKDNYPSTSAEGLPVDIQKIKVYYTRVNGKIYPTKQNYEIDYPPQGSQSQDSTESKAVAYQGELSKDPEVVIGDKKVGEAASKTSKEITQPETKEAAELRETTVQSEAAQIASQISADRVSGIKEKQESIGVGRQVGQEKAQAVGASGKNTVGIGENHNATVDVGGEHLFGIGNLGTQNNSQNNSQNNFQAIDSGALAAIAIGGTLSTGSGALISETLPLGAAAVGLGSLQGVQSTISLASGDVQNAINSNIGRYEGEFQQMGSVGVTNLSGSSNIVGFKRGISSLENLRAGQTIIAGSVGGDNGILLFAPKEEVALFAGFQSPIFVNTLSNGQLDPVQSPLAKSTLSAIGNSGGRRTSDNSPTPKDGNIDNNREGGSSLGNGGRGGNLPPRKPRLGGLPDEPQDDSNNEETNFEHLQKSGLGYDASDLDGKNTFQIDDEPEILDNKINPDFSFQDLNSQRLSQLQSNNAKSSGAGIGKFKNTSDIRSDWLQNLKEKFGRMTPNVAGNYRDAINKSTKTANAAVNKAVSQGLNKVKNEAMVLAGRFGAWLLSNIIPILLIVAAIVGMLIAIVIAPYCKPSLPTVPGLTLGSFRDLALEPTAWLAQTAAGSKSAVEKAGDIAKLGFAVTPAGIIYNSLTGGSVIPPSDFRKFIESQPLCDPPNSLCGQSGAGDAVNRAANSASIDCFKKQLDGKGDGDKVNIWRAQKGIQKTEISVKKVKNIIQAGNQAGTRSEVVAWVLSLCPTESDCEFDVFDATEQCYGIIQFCQSSNAGRTYQLLAKQVLGDENYSGPQLRKEPVNQMKMAQAGFDLKIKENRSKAQFNGKSDIYVAAYKWLGEGCDKYGTCTKDYGESADRNFKLITCDGGVTANLITPHQQDQANNYWSKAFEFPVVAKLGEQIKNPVLTGLQVLDNRIVAFNKAMGGKISVEAAADSTVISGTQTQELSVGRIAGIENNVRGGLLKHNDKVIPPEKKVYSPVNGKVVAVENSKPGNFGTAQGADFGNYVGIKIADGEFAGKTYWAGHVGKVLVNKDDNVVVGQTIADMTSWSGSGTGPHWSDMIADGSAITMADSQSDVAGSSKLAGLKIVGDGTKATVTFGDGTSSASNGAASSPSATDPCPPCPDGSGGSGNSQIQYQGEIFTPAVKAFLDTIAKWEAESGDTLSKESYNSGNYVANDINAETSTNLSPPFLKSNGKHPTKDEAAFNVGRYQYFGEWQSDSSYTGFKPKSKIGGDVAAANEGLKKAGINFVIKDFKPTSQDYYPIGKYANIASKTSGTEINLAKALGTGDEASFKKAVEIGSKEWASMPFFNSSQPKATYDEYLTYFRQRIAVHLKTTSFFNFSNIFGGLSVNAANTTSELRTKLAKLVEEDKIFKIRGREGKEGEIENIKNIYDDNLIKYYNDLWESGLSPVLGPQNYRGGTPGAGAGHKYATAVDIWGFALRSEVESGGPLKVFDGPTPMHGGGATETENNPFKEGNKSDPRIVRMADLLVLDKGSDLYKKTIERFNKADSIAANSGVAAFAITHDVHLQAISPKRDTVKGHKDPSVYKSGGNFYNGTNGHHSHYHVQFNPASNGAYKPNSGSGELSGDCDPCPTPTVTTPEKPTEPPVQGPVNQDPEEAVSLLNIFDNIKVAAASAPTSFQNLSAEHKKLLAEVAAAIKMGPVVEAGADKPEMLAAFQKFRVDAAGKGFTLVKKSSYRSYDTQMVTFFQNGQADKISEFYADGMSATDRERVKQGYIKRSESSHPPGFSEHHSGLAIDISASNKPASDNLGRETYPVDLANYLAENAPKFGFTLSFGKDSGGANGGAKYEPWHFYFGKSPSKSGAVTSNSKNPNCNKTSGSADLGANSTLANANPPKNFILTDETGKVIKQIDGDKAVEGASIFKVIVASVALKKGIDINKQIVLDEKSWLPDETKYTKDQSVSVSKLLFDMLNDSNNTAANALMNQYGGIGGGFDAAAKEAGYSSVAFGNYFRATARPVGDNEIGTRIASAADVNSAFIDMFKNAGGGLRHSKERFVNQSSYI